MKLQWKWKLRCKLNIKISIIDDIFARDKAIYEFTVLGISGIRRLLLCCFYIFDYFRIYIPIMFGNTTNEMMEKGGCE